MKKTLISLFLVNIYGLCFATDISCLANQSCFDNTIINKKLYSGALFTQCTESVKNFKSENPNLIIDEKEYCLNFDYRIFSQKIFVDKLCHANYSISYPNFISRPYSIKSEIRLLDSMKISDKSIIQGMKKFNPSISEQIFATNLVPCYSVN